jgi:tight adherence protein C
MLQEWIENLSSVRPEIFLGAFVFLLVVFVGAVVLAVRALRRQVAASRLERVELPKASTSVAGSRTSGYVRLVERVGNYASHGRASTTLWEQLIRAGYMNPAAPAIYTGIKMLLLAVGVTGGIFLAAPLPLTGSQKMLLVSLVSGLTFFLPNVVLRAQERKRREEIRRVLPDAIDLLEVCVSSGVGLDMAWNMVTDEIDEVSTVLGSAMDLCNFEMHLGASRTEAMRNMAMRTGAEQLSSLAALLVQSERFGSSVAAALQEFARWMREERQLRAEEEAEKLPVKMLYPMALLIFPAIMIVTVGPAVIHIMRTLGSP